MPRKSTRAASGSSPEKPAARTRTRRGQKAVDETAENEVIDEIPAHLLRASDESSEHSDNDDDDYGSPKKGRGRGGRGRGRKTKVETEKPPEKVTRPRRGRRAAQSPAADEQNSQEEYQESVNSQEEHETSTMESVEKEKSVEPETIEAQSEQVPEAIVIDEKKDSTEIVQDEKAADEQPIVEENKEKVSEVTQIEQDLQSNNDQATVNEDCKAAAENESECLSVTEKSEQQEVELDKPATDSVDTEIVDSEPSKSDDHGFSKSEVSESAKTEDSEPKESSNREPRKSEDSEPAKSVEPAESVDDDEVSKEAPELPSVQSDSRSNSSERETKEKSVEMEQDDKLRSSRSSSGEIHEDSVENMEVDSSIEIQNKKSLTDLSVKRSIIMSRKSPPKTDEKPQIQRKRKWGARKTDDEPVIAITTDSLKNVISEEVKPVDVKLASSPSPEPEEKRPRVKLTSEDRDVKKKLLKERLRKQEEEEDRRNEQIAKALERSQVSPTIIVTNGAGKERKVSVISNEEHAAPPTPPKNQISKIICITNLVRPLTFMAVKSLVARTGIIEDFWIDQIKSKCFVAYKTEDMAVETRHALHGVKWPEHNLKTLNVEFSTQDEMNKVIEATRGERITSESSNRETKQEKGFGWSKNDVPADDRSRSSRRVREWDVGKDADRDDDRESRRRRRSSEQREKAPREKRRSVSKSPVRDEQKENTPVPQQRLLDDLFRKTKSLPFIYWMPLSEEKIKELEEQRQKNIAEHNRRMEEVMRMQKERREAREQRMREDEKRREERRERDRRSRSRNRRRSRDRSSRDRNRRYDRR